jgi:Ca2+/Na+ antiporter
MSASERTALKSAVPGARASPLLAAATGGGSGGGGGGPSSGSSSGSACGRCLASCGAVCTRGVRGGCADFWSPSSALAGANLVFLGAPGDRPWFNLLLLMTPIALASRASGALAAPSVAFPLSLLAMLPLAERLGFCTEALSEHVSDTLAGLLNASMGNAPELVIAIIALQKGLLRVTQLSLLGSVLSNMLLVLGTALIVGGFRRNFQPFKAATSGLSSSMLITGCLAVLLPTVLVASKAETNDGVSALLTSRLAALALLALYSAYLFFQLYTHQ